MNFWNNLFWNDPSPRWNCEYLPLVPFCVVCISSDAILVLWNSNTFSHNFVINISLVWYCLSIDDSVSGDQKHHFQPEKILGTQNNWNSFLSPAKIFISCEIFHGNHSKPKIWQLIQLICHTKYSCPNDECVQCQYAWWKFLYIKLMKMISNSWSV